MSQFALEFLVEKSISDCFRASKQQQQHWLSLRWREYLVRNKRKKKIYREKLSKRRSCLVKWSLTGFNCSGNERFMCHWSSWICFTHTPTSCQEWCVVNLCTYNNQCQRKLSQGYLLIGITKINGDCLLVTLWMKACIFSASFSRYVLE
jgi:hypothetical protein